MLPKMDFSKLLRPTGPDGGCGGQRRSGETVFIQNAHESVMAVSERFSSRRASRTGVARIRTTCCRRMCFAAKAAATRRVGELKKATLYASLTVAVAWAWFGGPSSWNHLLEIRSCGGGTHLPPSFRCKGPLHPLTRVDCLTGKDGFSVDTSTAMAPAATPHRELVARVRCVR